MNEIIVYRTLTYAYDTKNDAMSDMAQWRIEPMGYKDLKNKVFIVSHTNADMDLIRKAMELRKRLGVEDENSDAR